MAKKKRKSTGVARQGQHNGGARTRLSVARLADDAKNVGLMVVGFIAAKKIAVIFDKATNTVSGFMGVDGTELKGVLTPVLTTLLGLGVHQLVKHPAFKMIGLGCAAYGTIQVVKKFTGTDYLAGIGDAETIAPAYQTLPQMPMPMPNPLMQFAGDFDNEQPVQANITAGVEDAPANIELSITAGVDDGYYEVGDLGDVDGIPEEEELAA